jgi:hypothetical protein
MTTPAAKEWDVILYKLWTTRVITYAGYLELQAMAGTGVTAYAYILRN